jgi:hypothetical protein
MKLVFNSKYRERPKRSRSVFEGVVVYDDDIDYPAFCRKRNVEKMDGYNEYCQLWREFIDLKTEVRWRNKSQRDKKIPRIQTLIEQTQKIIDAKDALTTNETNLASKKNTQKQKETDFLKELNVEKKRILEYENNILLGEIRDLQEVINLALKSPSKEELDKLVAQYGTFQSYHIQLWTQMDNLIKALSENAYVKNRNDDDHFKLEAYKGALYDMIDK